MNQQCFFLFSCTGCNIVAYCSTSCLIQSYYHYHRFECEGFQRHFWKLGKTDFRYFNFNQIHVNYLETDMIISVISPFEWCFMVRDTASTNTFRPIQNGVKTVTTILICISWSATLTNCPLSLFTRFWK